MLLRINDGARKIYNIAQDIESFGIGVGERDKLIVSDVSTNSVFAYSRFLPPPLPTGYFDVHR
jgi:hypothetical protein